MKNNDILRVKITAVTETVEILEENLKQVERQRENLQYQLNSSSVKTNYYKGMSAFESSAAFCTLSQ